MTDEKTSQTIDVLSLCNGTAFPHVNAPDNTVALGLFGHGAYIQLTGSQLFAPFDGHVINISPTCHTLTLRALNGLVLRIAFTPNVQSLMGLKFRRHSKNKHKISSGQCLLDFDINLLKQNVGIPGIAVTILNPLKSIELHTNHADKGRKIVALSDTLMTVCLK
ncbi:PTS glucose transporter subunit IIA [Alteromonas facilis]|uniref:PTS glucose transporter subunit IIA n=1 Tax=Alteromonas facilis TaxID=2048004 RepID=UPI000C28C25E|nr:PTS glucose transporter subunit IIA [Alteromonas facilis]